MINSWTNTTIGEFCPFSYGKGLPEKKRVSGEISVYGSNGIIGTHNDAFVFEEGIIIGRKGSIGEIFFSPTPFWPIDTTFYVVGSNSRDTRFTYYLLKTLGLHQMNSDSAVPGLNRDAAHKIQILVPPLPEQRAIADILGALDDKIELNRRMNHTLEELAQTLFKHWFIDNPERENWEEKPLDEIANFLNGLAMQKFPPKGDQYLPVIKIAQLRTNDTENADKASIELDQVYIVNDGDVLFSWSGSLEVVLWCGGKGALNQHLFKVTSNRYPKWFYYYWIKEHLSDFQEIAAGKATTMGHIQKHHLSEAKVLVPEETQMAEMSEIMQPMVEKIIANKVESRTLAELRDTLLPKLISGQVRVKSLQSE